MEAVIVHDSVFGSIALDDPLLVDVYHSKAVQRLSGIYQAGISAFVVPTRRCTTRLDHSVGVCALLRRLGADVIEQAAGLIHDTPHTAFSHVVDFLFPNREHTYHEVHREAVIAASDLPAILARHGLAWQVVSDADRFSLLEQPLPALCADRLDYFLRDGLTLGMITRAEVNQLLAHLRVHNGRIVIDDVEHALWLGEQFMALDKAVWCSAHEVGWYTAMAQALGAALQAGVIAEADLWSTDQVVMQRLRSAHNPDVDRWLAHIHPEVRFVRDDARPDLTTLPKARAIDPPVLTNGQVQPLSCLDARFDRRKTAYLAGKHGHWGLRIERQVSTAISGV